MHNPSMAYPHAAGETWREHFGFAFRFGLKMRLAGLAAMVHALLPCLLVNTAGRANDELQAMRLNSPGRRKSRQYQES